MADTVVIVIPSQPSKKDFDVKKSDVPDMNWVTSRLAVGGEITSKQMAQALADQGITAVLNVRTSQDEVPYVRKANMKYFSNPTKDQDDSSKPPEWFQASADVIRTQMSGPGSKVFVHCQEGINRAPGTVFFYLRTLGFDRDACENMITAVRPQTKGEMAWNDDAEAALKKLGYGV